MKRKVLLALLSLSTLAAGVAVVGSPAAAAPVPAATAAVGLPGPFDDSFYKARRRCRPGSPATSSAGGRRCR